MKDFKHGRYVDLTTDAGFKAVFCKESNSEALKALINAYMPEGKRVTELSMLDRELTIFSIENKCPRLDLHCVDEQGEHILVEIQKVSMSNLFKRMVYYASGVNYSNILKGAGWSQSVPPVYMIVICCGVLKEPELNEEHDMVSWFSMMDIKYKKLAPNVLNII